MGSVNKIMTVCRAVKDMMMQEGPVSFIYKLPGRVSKYLSHSLSADTFKFNGNGYSYCCSLFNFTFRTERAVEIPIALDYVERFEGKRIIEVGNVLNHYRKFEHDVVDKYEKVPGVINQDIAEYRPSKKYDLIVSISTIEHIGFDEEPKDKAKVVLALERMSDLLADNGTIIITFPWGYNTGLDAMLIDGRLKFDNTYYLKRISKNNKWRQTGLDEIRYARFGYPYPYGNALVVAEVRR